MLPRVRWCALFGSFMGRRKQLLKQKQKKSSLLGNRKRRSAAIQHQASGKNERNKRLVEATNASTSALSHAEKDAKRRRYDGSDSESESSDLQLQKAKELNIVNNSLTRLYQSHGHPSVTTTVTPVDNAMATMPSPPGTENLDNDEKVMLGRCSPAVEIEHKESHTDSSRGIKKVTQCLGNYPFVAATTETTVVSQATESSCEGHGVHMASATASVVTSNAIPHNNNATDHDGIPDASTLRSDESYLKKSGRVSKKKKNTQATREAETTNFVLQKSTVMLKDIGGIDHCLQEIDNLVMHFKHPKLFEHLGVVPIKGFLLYGPPGCGKTLLVHAIAGELDIPYIELAGTEIVKGVSGESENTLRRLFQQAKSNAPCILFLDDIDAICPKRETAQKEMERRIVSQLLSCFNDLSNSPLQHHVLVIGATNHLDSLDSALRSAGRFEKEISLGVPDEKARKKILEVLCRNLRLEDGFDHITLAHATPGFVGGDLTLLVKEAAMVAIRRILKQQQEPDDSGTSTSHESLIKMDSEVLLEQIPSDMCITNEDFKQALTTVQPSAKREGFASVPDATWDDIGALDHIKEELALCILAPVHHPEHFESLGLTTPTGVLLIGPPGCGKTLLAKAVANESGINFISVKGPELLNMYVGESEKAVRQVFQKARDSAPCVIFFDELDSLCPRRSESREGHSSARVVNQLLTEMDGMQSRRQVFVMAATNRPDILDKAVLRPGRLDKTLYIGLPTADERAVILKTITKKKPNLASDVELDVIAKDERCEGFSGADLSALVKEAAITALKETLPMVSMLHQRNNNATGPHPLINTVVRQTHFITAFSKITPSVCKEDQVRYQKMAKQMSSNFH